jgi:hypothetical protein
MNLKEHIYNLIIKKIFDKTIFIQNTQRCKLLTMFKSSVTKQILIKQQLYKILKKEDGKNAKRMNSGIFIGLFLGLLKTFLILTMVIEWVKCSK